MNEFSANAETDFAWHWDSAKLIIIFIYLFAN